MLKHALRLQLGLLFVAAGCTGPVPFFPQLDSGDAPAVDDGAFDSGSYLPADEERRADSAIEDEPWFGLNEDASVGASDAAVSVIIDAGEVKTDSGDAAPEPNGDAGPRIRVPLAGTTLDDVDAYVLARSIEQLASLELRREGRVVWRRTREQIQEFVPLPGPFHLTELAFKKRWLDTFWAWTYMQSGTAHADALRIARALASYFVGVRAVTVGPECGAASSYPRAELSAGRPGDDVPARLDAELRRSDQEVERLGAQAGAPCITGLQAVQPAERVAVIIDLPLDAAFAVGDQDLWTGDDQNKSRVGVPVPATPDLTNAGSALPVAETYATLARVDSYVLRHNLEQLAQLEVRRAGAPLFSRTYVEITPYLESGSAPALTALRFTRGWVDTLRSWLGNAGVSADPIRIAYALSAYFVGVRAISIGPECGPISGGYVYGFVSPGAPGDGVAAQLRAEIMRSEAAISDQIASSPSTSCITALRPNPTGNVAAQRVVIDLPANADSWVSDAQLWSESGGGPSRAGVPVPEATSLRRGREVR